MPLSQLMSWPMRAETHSLFLLRSAGHWGSRPIMRLLLSTCVTQSGPLVTAPVHLGSFHLSTHFLNLPMKVRSTTVRQLTCWCKVTSLQWLCLLSCVHLWIIHRMYWHGNCTESCGQLYFYLFSPVISPIPSSYWYFCLFIIIYIIYWVHLGLPICMWAWGLTLGSVQPSSGHIPQKKGLPLSQHHQLPMTPQLGGFRSSSPLHAGLFSWHALV